MKRILIINYGYSTKNKKNANSLCIESIINNLKKYLQFDILTNQGEQITKENIRKEENITIYEIPDYQLLSLEFKNNQIKSFIKKIYFKINKLWIKDSFNYFEKNLINNNYDTLISVSYPFTTIMIGKRIKKKYPHIKWVIYELDPHGYNNNSKNFLEKIYKIILEKKAFEYADVILLSSELYKQYNHEKNYFYKYNQKFHNVGIPLLKDFSKIEKSEKLIKNADSINIIYMGAFYKKIREPKILLDFFIQLLNINSKIKLHLFSCGCEDTINIYKNKFKDAIYLYDLVDHSTAISIMKEADILINLGNTTTNQVPSKIFEYIGLGKPIINIATINNDTSKYYLDFYQLGKTILYTNNTFNIEEISNINDFIISNYKKDICFDNISPELKRYTSERVSEIVYHHI